MLLGLAYVLAILAGGFLLEASADWWRFGYRLEAGGTIGLRRAARSTALALLFTAATGCAFLLSLG